MGNRTTVQDATERPRGVRKRNRWAAGAYLILFVAGAVLWPAAYTENMKGSYWVAAVVWVVALGVLLAMLIRRLDLFGGNHRPLLIAGFLWGCIPAIGFAKQINDLLVDDFDRRLAGFRAWDAAAVAPLVEESLKAAGIMLVLFVGRRYLGRASQAAVIGAVIGLGFQLAENINYVLKAASGHIDNTVGSDDASNTTANVVGTIVTRTVSALDSHWVFSALVGLGIGFAVVRRDCSMISRVGAAVAAFVTAVAMHFVIDSPKPEGAGGYVLLLCELVAILLAAYTVYRVAMKEEWLCTAAVAEHETTDAITPDELAAMRSHRTRRLTRKQLRRAYGTKAARDHQRRQHEQLRLINQLLRAKNADQEREAVQRRRNDQV